ncbi:MAG: bacillithiol biosynthesis deacetylase BshB1 [Solitalea-like symbiont of Tyrophagus putrescentiae]
MEKLDILAFGAHPDDVEAGCGGTLIKHVNMGYKVGVVDLTRGEMGSRGTVETRDGESKQASKIIGLTARTNLNLPDGFVHNTKENRLKIIEQIRLFKPEILLVNPFHDRHPDHERSGKLVSEAAFLSGLKMIETQHNGIKQEHWRPKVIYQYILSRLHVPDFVITLTDAEMEKKLEALCAYETQFCIKDKQVVSLDNFISKDTKNSPYQYERNNLTPLMSSLILGRARDFASPIEQLTECKYAEGFLTCRIAGVNNLFNLL